MGWFLTLDREVQLAILGILAAITTAGAAVWKDSKRTVPSRSNYSHGAIVDSSAVTSLSSAIETAALMAAELEKKRRDRDEALIDAVRDLGERVRDMTEQLREVCTEIQITREVAASNRRTRPSP